MISSTYGQLCHVLSKKDSPDIISGLFKTLQTDCMVKYIILVINIIEFKHCCCFVVVVFFTGGGAS